MCTAFKIFLHLLLIQVFENVNCGDPFSPSVDYGIALYKKGAAKETSTSSAGLVFAQEGLQSSFCPPTPAFTPSAQQTSFTRPTSPAFDPCSPSRSDDFQATIMEMCHVPRGNERFVPTMLEMWSRVGFMLRPHLRANRPAASYLQPADRTASTMGWSMAWIQFWFVEPKIEDKKVVKSWSQKQQESRILARWGLAIPPQGQWQGTGAVSASTGPYAAIHALSSYDATDSSTDDATSTSTAYERQGCWKRSTSTSSYDAHDWSACNRYGSPSSHHALGIDWTDDSLSCSTLVPCSSAGTDCDPQAGRPCPTKVEQTFEGDEERGGQPVAASSSHCPRDAETGREEQYQKPLLSSEITWGGEARIARSGKCTSAASIPVENVSAADCREVARICHQLSCFRKCPSARCSSSSSSGQTCSTCVRFGLKKGASWTRRDSHHLGRGGRQRRSRRYNGGSPRRECATHTSRNGFPCIESRRALLDSRSVGAARQASQSFSLRWKRCLYSCAAFWSARCCMTDMYTHQGLLARPVTSPEAMKLQWSHSVLLERDYLSEWRAQECASMLAADMGSSAWLRVDTISLPMRRRCKSGHVRFCDNVTVLIGEDDGLDFRPTMIHHSALSDFQDKPWRLRSHSSKLRSEHQDSAVTSFMARRPSQPARSSPSAISSASSSSTSTSSSSSQARSTEWRQTVLILLDGRILPARLPWNDGEQLIIHVQQAIGDQGQGLYGLHHVSHRPEDLLQQGLECLLVQTGLEPRPSTFLRLILVDLEIFEPNEVLPGAFKRFAKWIPESVNRVSVFRLLGLESLLRAHPERSHLWHNNIIVPENQISPIYPRDGDYLHILIGDSVDGFPCLPSSPTSFSEDNTEENDTISGLQTSSWTTSFQAPTTESTDVDPLSNVASCISSIDFCKQQPYMQSTNEPFSYFSSREDDGPTDHNLDYFGRPPRVEQPIWQHEVWDLLRAHGEVEMEEEGPIIYVTSHYISHTRVPRNTVTRPLRFDTDHETWEASVRFMWEDFIDDQMPLDIFLVIPAPPTTVYQGTVATVLITQHPLPDRAACVLSTSMVGHTHLRNVQTAYSAAIPCMVDDLIAVADEHALCAPADAGLPPCQIWNGPQELPHGHEVHVHDGLGLQVLIPEARAHDTVISPEVGTEVGTDPTHINDEEDVEDTALLTTKPAAVTCGLDLPSGVEETNFCQQTSVRLEQPVLQFQQRTLLPPRLSRWYRSFSRESKDTHGKHTSVKRPGILSAAKSISSSSYVPWSEQGSSPNCRHFFMHGDDLTIPCLSTAGWSSMITL